MKRDLVYTTGELPTRPFDATRFLTPSPHQNRCRGPRVEKVGLVPYCGAYMVIFRGGNPNKVPLQSWKEPFDKILYWLFRSHHGVSLFFLLSGFLIMKVALSKDFHYGTFLGKRALRIYTAFILALVVCLAVGR
jgi:exopolysaccharide production protein ExoZ